jgi:NAD(P)-dependent dehydrogenase (short-subunit alcohol dehydrogenase family)
VGYFKERISYEGRRALVTGCSSGIGAQVAQQLAELGADVVGLDLNPPSFDVGQFVQADLGDPASIDRAVAAIGGPVDALFNIAGVSSGIGDPLKVVTINFLGLRYLSESLYPLMPAGSAILNTLTLVHDYADYNARVRPLLATSTMAEGVEWAAANPDAYTPGGYTFAKAAIAIYSLDHTAELAARGIRINCTGPGVTDTPILNFSKLSYGENFADAVPKPLGRISDPAEQAAVMVFLNSNAASYLTGQVIFVDAGYHAVVRAEQIAAG